MNPAKRTYLSKRWWLRCDTTRAGETRPFVLSSELSEGGTSFSGSAFVHRSADIALVAGGNRKRWIIATEKMEAGDIIKTSPVIGRMAGGKLLRSTPTSEGGRSRGPP